MEKPGIFIKTNTLILHHITLYTLIQMLVTNSQGSINIQVKMKDPLNLNLELKRLSFIFDEIFNLFL